MIAIEMKRADDPGDGVVIELMNLPRRNETIELKRSPSGHIHRYLVRDVIHRQGRCPQVVVS